MLHYRCRCSIHRQRRRHRRCRRCRYGVAANASHLRYTATTGAGWLTEWLGWLLVCTHFVYVVFILFCSLFVRWRSLWDIMRSHAPYFRSEIHSYLISHWTFRENSLCLTLNEDGCVLYFFSLSVLHSQHSAAYNIIFHFVYDNYELRNTNKKKIIKPKT